MSTKLTTVDEYISAFPKDRQKVLQKVRKLILKRTKGGEAISYGMPNFTYSGRSLIQVGGWEKHIGLYPVGPQQGPIEKRLAPYRDGKATLQLPWTDTPYDLIEDLVEHLIAERGTADATAATSTERPKKDGPLFGLVSKVASAPRKRSSKKS